MGNRGTNERGDVLSTTADGRSLTTLWAEFSEALRIANESRTPVVELLTFQTTLPGDEVAQAPAGPDFEEASEFGEPKGIKVAPAPVTLGFTRKDYDLAKRFTWQFLRDATSEQVSAVHNAAVEADNRNLFVKTLAAIFNNTNRTNPEGFTVYPAWSNDGMVPPPWEGNSFVGSHQHYMFTGVLNTWDPGDIDALLGAVTEHGYGQPGSDTQLLLLINPAQEGVVRALRAGQGSPAASADFIPAVSAAPYLTDQTVIGQIPPASYEGVEIIGSYGRAFVISTYHVPDQYMISMATGGRNSRNNPVGFREHPSAGARGLIQVPGPRPDYPLVDSFYLRTFGTGVRHRGAVAVMKADTAYSVPTAYVGVG